jgi:hypothetical protein
MVSFSKSEYSYSIPNHGFSSYAASNIGFANALKLVLAGISS